MLERISLQYLCRYRKQNLCGTGIIVIYVFCNNWPWQINNTNLAVLKISLIKQSLIHQENIKVNFLLRLGTYCLCHSSLAFFLFIWKYIIDDLNSWTVIFAFAQEQLYREVNTMNLKILFYPLVGQICLEHIVSWKPKINCKLHWHLGHYGLLDNAYIMFSSETEAIIYESWTT